MPGFIAQLRPVTAGDGAGQCKAFGFPAEVRPASVAVGRSDSASTEPSPWGAPMRPRASGWSLPLIPGNLSVTSGFEEILPAPAQQSAA